LIEHFNGVSSFGVLGNAKTGQQLKYSKVEYSLVSPLSVDGDWVKIVLVQMAGLLVNSRSQFEAQDSLDKFKDISVHVSGNTYKVDQGKVDLFDFSSKPSGSL
jgi:hypothetical protein